MVLTWKGRLLTELTREELIEALEVSAELIKRRDEALQDWSRLYGPKLLLSEVEL
jgi:hypothetical protein